MVASSFWDMRLSVACVATDAEYQNRITQRDQTLNFPVVARQPHPDQNAAPQAARQVACPIAIVPEGSIPPQGASGVAGVAGAAGAAGTAGESERRALMCTELRL